MKLTRSITRCLAILFSLTVLPVALRAEPVNHAGIIEELDSSALERGKKIYENLCFACHGRDGRTPTNPQARSFAEGEMKNGADPFAMWKTLTNGFNTMPTMRASLSPQQRYDVIHYVRETFLKKHNPDQYVEVDPAYLASLPVTEESARRLDDRERDYGPVLGAQLGKRVQNALHFRLPHEVTYSFDLHRFRSAGLWSGGFLDLSQTHHYQQRGEGMPKRDGEPIPGLGTFAWELGGSFDRAGDVKPPRGPVRNELAHYHGHYLHGDRAVLSYRIGERDVLETVGVDRSPQLLALHHTLRVAPGEAPMRLAVARFRRGRSTAGVVPLGATAPTARSGPAGGHLAMVRGRPPVTDIPPRHVIAGEKARELDLGTPGRSVIVRFRTERGGTLVASAPAEGEWKPDGKTLFIRGGRVVFDIGWVGAMVSKSKVNDGRWHTAALVVTEQRTRLYVDGQQEAERKDFRRDPVEGHVLKIGATASDFGGEYRGEFGWVHIYDEAMSEREVAAASREPDEGEAATLLEWEPDDSKDKPEAPPTVHAAAAVVGDTDGLRWSIDDTGRAMLTIPPSSRPRVLRIIRSSGRGEADLRRFSDYVTYAAANTRLTDLKDMTGGGPRRWEQELTVQGQRGEPINGYALDTIPVPFDNPYNAWLRTSALDFFPDGRCVVTTYGGDVWIVSGLDAGLGEVTWSRYCAGLFEPFGVRVVDGKIYVTCRDGIKRLHDYNGDGEADFVEAFHIDRDVSSMFHAFNFDLQTDSDGNFYFAKAGQYTNYARPGTIMKVPPSGGPAEVVAWGLRTPNGMGRLPGDRFVVSDNQGPWMPAGKISLIEPGAFLGNMPINAAQADWLKARHGGELPETFDEPFIWMPQALDNSCGGQVWAGDERWGPLAGRLIHSSFGKGWLYYLSLQETKGTMQSSIVALPHQWDAGVMRLRVNPQDGQVYGVGLSGWQGPSGGKDGCLQRLRYTGGKARVVKKTRVTRHGLELTFNFPLDPGSARQPGNWDSEMWDYRWSKNYGSDQYSVRRPEQKGHDRVRVEAVELSDDRRTAHLRMPGLAVCDQLRLDVEINAADGAIFEERIYFTIHEIPGGE